MTHDALTFAWLAESALRSLALGAAVLALLKLARLRDVRAETLIWVAVLLAALAMPAFSLWPPGRFVLVLPRLAAAGFSPSARAGTSAASHGVSAAALLWGVYGLGALAGLARLGAGLAFTRRLCRDADPVPEPWAAGHDIRYSAAISAPFSVADCILLPADYFTWPEAKRLAVLAHEEAHVRRGDFFILLLASVHRALFWFNPFAWWLQAKLSALAERASDEAAVSRLKDPARYAEILLEVARSARGPAPAPAMARGPRVARRVEDILSPRLARPLGAPLRIAAFSAVLAAGIGFAGVQAADATAGATPPAWLHKTADRPAQPGAATARRVPSTSKAHIHSPRHPAPGVLATPAAAVPQPATAVTYNPRALIEDPDAAILPALVAAGGGPGVLVPELSKTGSGD